MEALFPTAFVALMMGASAIAVAAISLVIPSPAVQVILWLVLSTLGTIFSRRWLSPAKSTSLLRDSHEGETLTEISSGAAGRVLYEGNSWRAICGDEKLAISCGKKVYIVGRQGNTLIVLPAELGG
jgi:membrane protein implicated in regulation of membrane protease activity